MSTLDVRPAASPAAAATVKYNYGIGYLKAFIVVLVVAHHAALAYHPSATPPPVSLLKEPRFWQAFPVYDSHHAAWAGVFATVNDMFFMALMFFVSGLFVWNSLKRKGSGAYLGDRLLRLGLPFIPAAVIIAPLSYYPTYLQMAGHGSFVDFLEQWLALGKWSAGPVWFCWVLLVFDLFAVTLFTLCPRSGEALKRLAGRVHRPRAFFGLLVALGLAAYLPMVLAFGPFQWASWGPFTFQTSRILFYLVYFFAGIGVGAWGLENGILARGGTLARRWLLWLAIAVAAFLAHAEAIAAVLQHPLPQTWQEGLQAMPVLAAIVLFTVFCAATCFACLALFIRFMNVRMALWENLSRNAYGIFVIHFVFVSWIGYALAGAEAPALAKFALVTMGALALSWAGTILIRRIPGATRVL